MQKLIRLSDELTRQLEVLARQNKRSFTAEVTVALEQYVKQHCPDVQFSDDINRRNRTNER